MEIGHQIKSLRLQRGDTQETLAEALGVTAQAVSKWENNVAAPDIGLLPAISAYFGVTIDELFALTDGQRVERIENMLGLQRDIDPAVMDREAAFLLDKARREPKNERVYTLLAWLENHRSDTHRRRAVQYAKMSLERRADNTGALWELAGASGLRGPYWELADSHRSVIDYLTEFISNNPGVDTAYVWLIEALLRDDRFGEATDVLDKLEPIDGTWQTPHYRGLITWRSGDRAGALKIWEQMAADFPEDWTAQGVYAEDYAMTGDFAGAAELYERAKRLVTRPRPTSPWEVSALYLELAGNIEGAIRNLEEQLDIMAEDFGQREGAGVEAIRHEIARLRVKLLNRGKVRR